jgi:hypothetical protein
MKQKSNISELEQLRIRKIRLQAKLDTHASELDHHLSYLQDNMGSLLFNSAVGAVRSKLPPVVQGFLPDFSEGNKPVHTQAKTLKNESKTSLLIDQVIDIVPVIFKGAKPLLISLLLKQVKKIFMKK